MRILIFSLRKQVIVQQLSLRFYHRPKREGQGLQFKVQSPPTIAMFCQFFSALRSQSTLFSI